MSFYNFLKLLVRGRILTVSFISFWFYQAVDRGQRYAKIQNNYSRILICPTQFFSNLWITRTKNSFLFSVIHCNFNPNLSNSDFSRQFSFPLRFEKSGFHCIFEMIVSLDVRIPLFLLRFECAFAHCDFFRAIRSPLPLEDSSSFRTQRSPPPKVQRCPYAYGLSRCYL